MVQVADCQDLIKIVLNVSVSADDFVFSLTPLLNGKSGFLGEHSILGIQLKEFKKELKFFVKSMFYVESQRKFIEESGAFFKEEKMFCEMVPLFLKHGVKTITECMPKCFAVFRSEVFIFEDLSSRGYKILNHRDSYDLPKTKTALNAIAKLHASSIILEEKLKCKNRPYRLIDDFKEEFREAFYTNRASSIALRNSTKKGTETHINLFPDPSGELSAEKLKEFSWQQFDNYLEFVKPSKKFRNVICHGDLWATNIMFKFDQQGEPIDCYLVDFQSYRYCPPAQDIMSFIYLVTDRKFRQHHMEDVLLYYYNQLGEILLEYGIKIDDVVTYEEYQQSCKDYKLFAVMQQVSHSQMVMMNSEDLQSFFNTPGYSQRIMFEDRSELILRLCQTDEEYRQKQFECITELREIYKELN